MCKLTRKIEGKLFVFLQFTKTCKFFQTTAFALLVGFTDNFCIDLSGGRRKMYRRLYAAQEWANDSKLHIFVTKHNSDIYHEN